MGTKNNPGKFDCYENAKPDEPMFIFLARDPLAADLVRIWANIRNGDPITAVETFSTLIKNHGLDYIVDGAKQFPKVEEAMRCADEMDDYSAAMGRPEPT